MHVHLALEEGMLLSTPGGHVSHPDHGLSVLNTRDLPACAGHFSYSPGSPTNQLSRDCDVWMLKLQEIR